MLRLVTFFGDEVGSFGMPKPFHQYAVFVTEKPAPGVSGSAIITTITGGTPLPPQAAFAAQGGGTDEAYRLALDALKRLHSNLRLTEAS
jgi:hypothetical protein